MRISASPLARADPFFASSAPHQNVYLESLHRTFGEPKGALPKRDEEMFARALAFRDKEKQHYGDLESENKKLQDEHSTALNNLTSLQTKYETMKQEADEIRNLWQELSKTTKKDERSTAARGGDTAKARRSTRDRPDSKPAAKAPSRAGRKRGTVPGEVLLGDPSGHADEHVDERREQRSGVESERPAEPEEPVPEPEADVREAADGESGSEAGRDE